MIENGTSSKMAVALPLQYCPCVRMILSLSFDWSVQTGVLGVSLLREHKVGLGEDSVRVLCVAHSFMSVRQIVYEQDWLDVEFENLYYLQESATAGRQWLMQVTCSHACIHVSASAHFLEHTQMGTAAANNDLTIQYCSTCV